MCKKISLNLFALVLAKNVAKCLGTFFEHSVEVKNS